MLKKITNPFSHRTKKTSDKIKKISKAYQETVEECDKKFEEYQRNDQQNKKKAIDDANMKFRQYDQLMDMNHGENYIDPVTGKTNESEKYKRSREIYAENLKDTGKPF